MAINFRFAACGGGGWAAQVLQFLFLYTFEFRTPGPLAVSRSRSYFSAPGTMVTHTAAKRESVYTLRWLINFLRLPRTVLETEGPGASQPVSNIQLETRAKSSAEFPKPLCQRLVSKTRYLTVKEPLTQAVSIPYRNEPVPVGPFDAAHPRRAAQSPARSSGAGRDR